MAVVLCADWMAGCHDTCYMDTCDEHVLLCRQWLFIPPPFTRNFMATSDDRVFTNCGRHISYTGCMSLNDGGPARQWVIVM